MLAGVGELEASTERKASIELHPALQGKLQEDQGAGNDDLVVKAVLVFYLLRYQGVVTPLPWLVPHAFPLVGLAKGLC